MADTVFQGEWICAEEFGSKTPLPVFHRQIEMLNGYLHDENLKNRHMLVRKTFKIGRLSENTKLTMRITADDYYKLFINGGFVGQGPAPGYFFAYYFNEFDIAPYVREGENSIFIDVYYQGLINRVWNSGDYRQGMIADILLDGKLLIATDGSWEYTMSRSYGSKRLTGYDTQYLEDYDSRQKPESWRPVRIKSADYTFCPVPAVPVEVYDKLPVASRPVGGGWSYDFGTELTAGLHITACGKSGQRLRILCGEECTPDGRVRYDMRCNCAYEEFWTLDDGENDLMQYDYKAFRYVELIPEDRADIAVRKVKAAVRHYPFPENACTLKSSDKVLDAVFALCKNGVKYGCQEIYVDCPSREKAQYSGDLTITSASQLLLTGDPSLLRKAIENQVQSLRIAPGLLAVAPGSFMQEIADYSLQFPLLVWRYYQYTGDRAFLQKMIEPCDRLVAYFEQYERGDELLECVDEKWNLVDWPENLRDNYDFPLTIPVGPGCHNVVNAFYAGCVKYVERIKRELGIPYTGKSERLTEAFNRCFFRKETGTYADSEKSAHASLHANCLPVFYGLQPDSGKETIAALLVEKGLCGGVYMAYFLLKALAALGKYEAVFNLITSTGPNSWYNMVREGGTACFEAWGKDRKWNTSLCHPWASAPVSVIVEDLVGLRPLSPGFEKIRITPRLPADFELKMDIPLPSGTVHFEQSGGRHSYSFIKR